MQNKRPKNSKAIYLGFSFKRYCFIFFVASFFAYASFVYVMTPFGESTFYNFFNFKYIFSIFQYEHSYSTLQGIFLLFTANLAWSMLIEFIYVGAVNLIKLVAFSKIMKDELDGKEINKQRDNYTKTVKLENKYITIIMYPNKIVCTEKITQKAAIIRDSKAKLEKIFNEIMIYFKEDYNFKFYLSTVEEYNPTMKGSEGSEVFNEEPEILEDSNKFMKLNTVNDEPLQRLSIELNTAAKEELMKLPGISEKVVDKIIQNRPYKNLDKFFDSFGMSAYYRQRYKKFLFIDKTLL